MPRAPRVGAKSPPVVVRRAEPEDCEAFAHRKFGFVVDGTHKGYALRAGRYADVHFMARIRAKKAG